MLSNRKTKMDNLPNRWIVVKCPNFAVACRKLFGAMWRGTFSINPFKDLPAIKQQRLDMKATQKKLLKSFKDSNQKKEMEKQVHLKRETQEGSGHFIGHKKLLNRYLHHVMTQLKRVYYYNSIKLNEGREITSCLITS